MIPLAQWTSCVLSLAVLQSLRVWIKPRPQNKGTNDFPRYCKMVYLMWGRFFSSLLPSFLCSFLSSSFFPFLHSFLFSDPICHCQRCDNMSWHKQLKGLRVYFGLQFHGNTSWWGRQNPRAAGSDAGGKSWLVTWSLHSWIRDWLGRKLQGHPHPVALFSQQVSTSCRFYNLFKQCHQLGTKWAHVWAKPGQFSSKHNTPRGVVFSLKQAVWQ